MFWAECPAYFAAAPNPSGLCAKALKALENWAPNYRYVPYETVQSTFVKDLIFREASGDFVLCMLTFSFLREFWQG